MPASVGPNARSRPWQAYALVLAVAAASCALERAGALKQLELKALDGRFALRDRLRGDTAPRGRPKPIVLIEIDDESARLIPEPYILWDRHFALVFGALAESGARAIAADILWLKSIDDFLELKGESPRKTLVKSLMSAGKKTTLVLAALGDPSSGAADRLSGTVGGGYSLGKYAAVVGARSFAIVNPVPDEDGVIRRQRPSYAVASAAGGLAQSPTFPYVAAAALAGGPPTSGGGEVLIDFSAAALPFDRRTFHEVLAKARGGDREYFQKTFGGRVALIGTTSTINDRLPTPLGTQTPGVWIHAFAIDSFLSGAPLRPGGPVLQSALVVALGCAAGVLALWGSWSLAIFGSGALILGWLGAAQLLFHARLVVGVTGPLASIVLCSATTLLYRFTVAERDQRRLANVLKGYVNPKIVEEALNAEDPASILTGRRRRVAILFSDVRGFTKISETLPPEGVVKFLNRYLSAMSDIILDHGGTIDKFVGDGIMGFFGAPVDRPDGAMQAIRVALAMQAKLGELNVEWQAAGLPEVKIGVGIHAGDAVVGNIGSLRKMDYTAIGDTTNLASRVESLTKDLKRSILITQAVYDEVKDLVVSEPMGSADVRGHTSVELYAVSGIKAETRAP